MKEIVKLTDKEIKDAIVLYIGLGRGQSFFPYRIKRHVGMDLYAEVTFELEMIPKGTKTESIQ